MKIDLNKKIQTHLQRLESLANEAAGDTEESYSSRASALTALTAVLKELTKTQAEVINMERLMRIEATTIEVLKRHLTSDQHEEFLLELEESLNVGQ